MLGQVCKSKLWRSTTGAAQGLDEEGLDCHGVLENRRWKESSRFDI